MGKARFVIGRPYSGPFTRLTHMDMLFKYIYLDRIDLPNTKIRKLESPVGKPVKNHAKNYISPLVFISVYPIYSLLLI